MSKATIPLAPQRCPDGILALVEPANTPLSRIILRFFHNEPFRPEVVDWRLPAGGPLSRANGALPWIVFERDRERFNRLFPELTISSLRYRHPLVYLLSGGVSQRQLCPDSMMGMVKTTEKLLKPLNPLIGLFMRVVVKRR